MTENELLEFRRILSKLQVSCVAVIHYESLNEHDHDVDDMLTYWRGKNQHDEQHAINFVEHLLKEKSE